MTVAMVHRCSCGAFFDPEETSNLRGWRTDGGVLWHDCEAVERSASPFNVVITGSREWTDVETIRIWIEHMMPDRLAHGCARGADQIAGRVARELGIEVVEYPVDQEVDGPWPAAGHRRNARMVDIEEPKRVLAFSVAGPPEMTRGTGHCAGYAWGLRVPVLVVPPGARP